MISRRQHSVCASAKRGRPGSSSAAASDCGPTSDSNPTASLADARKEARKLLTEEPTKADRMTFDAAYELFKEALKAKKERTQYDYKRVLEKHLQPKFRSWKLGEISYEDIVKITDTLSRGEKRNTLAVARTFFRWCVRPPRKYLKHSPLEGVEVPKAHKRKRILNPEELIKVWHAAIRQGYPHGTVCQLLMLTGQRDARSQTYVAPGSMRETKRSRFPIGSARTRKSIRSPMAT